MIVSKATCHHLILILICDVHSLFAADFCTQRFQPKLRALAQVDKQLDILWNALTLEDISSTENAIYEARAQVNRDNLALIGASIVGNIVKLYGRVRISFWYALHTIYLFLL